MKTCIIFIITILFVINKIEPPQKLIFPRSQIIISQAKSQSHIFWVHTKLPGEGRHAVCPGKEGLGGIPREAGNNITALSTDPTGRGELSRCFPRPYNCGLSQNIIVYLIKQGWQQWAFAGYLQYDRHFIFRISNSHNSPYNRPSSLNMPMNHLEILLDLIRFKFSRTSTAAENSHF